MDILNNFIAIHKPQLIASCVPEHFWPVLCRKLSHQIFDAGEAFSLLQVDYSDDERVDEDPIFTLMVTKEDGLKKNSQSDIYLIDHAWTFRLEKARQQLQEIPGLATRMGNIMGVAENDDEAISKILKQICRFANMYMIHSDNAELESRIPIWYIMDEVGSAIIHNHYPNFRLVPFMYVNQQITYSLLFPIEDVERGDAVTRNFVEGIGTSIQEKLALLLPWIKTDFSSENFNQEEPEQDYFLDGHIEETVPDSLPDRPIIDRNRPLKVFTEYDLIKRYLTDESFEIVATQDEADVLWLTTHFKNFKELQADKPNRFINQFPFEHVLTIKDLLSIVCRRSIREDGDKEPKPVNEDNLETYPKWLPATYNLKTELIQFVSYYQNRSKRNLDNHWICKPWNLARGLDTHITDDLAFIMRLPPSGPKIAQKYIENPVLFQRDEIDGKVKFDVRYVILLKSVAPFEAYIYRNFFLRFANKPFELSLFDDYEKHFTVMNYSEFNLRHMPCADFLKEWQKQYPTIDWELVERDICSILKEVIIKSSIKLPPAGIKSNPQCRALYASDIILSWQTSNKETIQPKLLEINWVPDCQRACDYYPDFYNDIFKLMFLDIPNDKVFRSLF